MDLWLITSGSIAAIIIGLGIIFVWMFIKERRSGYPSQDERTRRITGKAATYALYIGQYFTIALLAANIISREFYGQYAYEEGYALLASMLSYSLSFIGLRMFFNRKGDF
ncbi:MAG: hypothetical protein QG670_2147 [Thermoproteota archaeon]|nr:hypothetical protein [Thermoproteota archaeon]